MKDELSHHRALKKLSDYEAIGTVEEFKIYKECNISKANFSMGYNKAIDELLEKQLDILEDFKNWEDSDGYPIHSLSETQRISKCKELIKRVANQLKESRCKKMRLIDAEALNKTIFEIGCHKTKINTMDIMDIIKEQPTAYDIENVVAELENAYPINPYPNDFSNGRDMAIRNAINIVRKGGVENESQ